MLCSVTPRNAGAPDLEKDDPRLRRLTSFFLFITRLKEYTIFSGQGVTCWNSQLLESGAGPLLLAHRVVPGVLALSLTRQVGGGSSVLLHDYASVLLQPPDLLLKAAASISLLGNHTHRM